MLDRPTRWQNDGRKPGSPPTSTLGRTTWPTSHRTKCPGFSFAPLSLSLTVMPIRSVVFLESIEQSPALPSRLVSALNKAYSLDGTNNQEIRLRWYAVALKAGQFKEEAAEWVKDKGRMKFAR